MAGLLVSVRTSGEAIEAFAAGAAVIDLKEPGRGSLGRADGSIWQSVFDTLPERVLLSAALGELAGWVPLDDPARRVFNQLDYVKLGLAHAPSDWIERWREIQSALPAGPGWIAVAYADWRQAGAPDPDAVLAAACALGCAGVLVDTFKKDQRVELGTAAWGDWACRARAAGLRLALAGGLRGGDFARLAFLRPDWFAVRGAACREGHRDAPLDQERVEALAAAAAAAADLPSNPPAGKGSIEPGAPGRSRSGRGSGAGRRGPG